MPINKINLSKPGVNSPTLRVV